MPLFFKTVKIYDDSVRINPETAVPFPFELRFPEVTQKGLSGGWETDSRFTTNDGEPLPPSWMDSYSGFSNHYEAFVEYRIGVRVSVPRLQLNITKPEEKDETLVHYERPRMYVAINDKPQPRKGTESVKNEFLLPEADRPTGFRQKTKAAFSSDYYPTYAFDWTLTAPGHIYLGQPLAFEMFIRPRENECTAPLIPEVFLSYLTIGIKATVDVRAEKQIFTTPEASSTETRATLKGHMDDAGPFAKANDWSKTINTRELRGIASTFSTPNVSVRYRMQVSGAFTLAGKTKDFKQEFGVVVYPPLETVSKFMGQKLLLGVSVPQ